MRKYEYRVYFVNGDSIIVDSFNSSTATILAQAERINSGLIYEVKKVERIDG
jgi:hypothetical protein